MRIALREIVVHVHMVHIHRYVYIYIYIYILVYTPFKTGLIALYLVGTLIEVICQTTRAQSPTRTASTTKTRRNRVIFFS